MFDCFPGNAAAIERPSAPAPLRAAPSSTRSVEEARKRYSVKLNQLQAGYDSALWVDEDYRHWVRADHFSPARATNITVRRRIRSRARYEFLENNSWALGLVNLKADDVVGAAGPTLQARSDSADMDREREAFWLDWAEEVNLPELLHRAYVTRVVSGEVFIIPSTDPNMDHPVKMRPRLLEPDQVSHPTWTGGNAALEDDDPLTTDGIHYDQFGNPTAYDILTEHPGAGLYTRKFITVPASQVIHYYKPYRPDQPRGVSEVCTALKMFGFIRRFTLATIIAAETAADHAAILKTDAAAVCLPDQVADEFGGMNVYQDQNGININYDPGVTPGETIAVDRGMMTALPAGYSMEQLKAEHPTTTFEMFVSMAVNETARCLQIPYYRALGKSLGFTFASGKIDRDGYLDHIDYERRQAALCVLRKLTKWFWAEAALAVPQDGEFRTKYTWPRHRETEPAKQAQADLVYWNAGFMTTQEWCEQHNIDYATHMEGLAEDIELRAEINASLPGRQPIVPVEAEDPNSIGETPPEQQNADDTAEDEEDDEDANAETGEDGDEE